MFISFIVTSLLLFISSSFQTPPFQQPPPFQNNCCVMTSTKLDVTVHSSSDQVSVFDGVSVVPAKQTTPISVKKGAYTESRPIDANNTYTGMSNGINIVNVLGTVGSDKLVLYINSYIDANTNEKVLLASLQSIPTSVIDINPMDFADHYKDAAVNDEVELLRTNDAIINDYDHDVYIDGTECRGILVYSRGGTFYYRGFDINLTTKLMAFGSETQVDNSRTVYSVSLACNKAVGTYYNHYFFSVYHHDDNTDGEVRVAQLSVNSSGAITESYNDWILQDAGLHTTAMNLDLVSFEPYSGASGIWRFVMYFSNTVASGITPCNNVLYGFGMRLSDSVLFWNSAPTQITTNLTVDLTTYNGYHMVHVDSSSTYAYVAFTQANTNYLHRFAVVAGTIQLVQNSTAVVSGKKYVITNNNTSKRLKGHDLPDGLYTNGLLWVTNSFVTAINRSTLEMLTTGGFGEKVNVVGVAVSGSNYRIYHTSVNLATVQSFPFTSGKLYSTMYKHDKTVVDSLPTKASYPIWSYAIAGHVSDLKGTSGNPGDTVEVTFSAYQETMPGGFLATYDPNNSYQDYNSDSTGISSFGIKWDIDGRLNGVGTAATPGYYSGLAENKGKKLTITSNGKFSS